MNEKQINSKENEKKYIRNLTAKEKKWVRTKPFGDFNYQESALRIRDFSYILELFSLKEERHYSVLDLGCGPGWTSIFLAKMGANVTGVDISEDMIKIAKENARKDKLKINFISQDIEKINFSNQFDRVLSYDALHHCPDEKKVLKNAYQALKPGGLLLIVEPNKMHQENPCTIAVSKRFGVLEKGYTPAYLKREMTKIGFKKITRYHCYYNLNIPMPSGTKSLIRQMIRLLAHRAFYARYRSQVWILAGK